MLNKWLNIALDLIYPPKCPVCKAVVERTGKWCDKCFEAAFIDKPKKISLAKHDISCLKECVAVCNYSGIVRNFILDMKFNKNKRRGIYLAYILERQFSKGVYQSKVDVVVPVPLNAQKLKERGFNQTESIFGPWAQTEKLPWVDALERTRSTQPQWQLGTLEREKNIKGAFALSRLFKEKSLLNGKSILLVDDILTTGKTIKECAEALNEAGPKQITGLVLASSDW